MGQAEVSKGSTWGYLHHPAHMGFTRTEDPPVYCGM